MTKGDAGAGLVAGAGAARAPGIGCSPTDQVTDQVRPVPTSHSFGSMCPRFLTTLNVPPSDRAMRRDATTHDYWRAHTRSCEVTPIPFSSIVFAAQPCERGSTCWSSIHSGSKNQM